MTALCALSRGSKDFDHQQHKQDVHESGTLAGACTVVMSTTSAADMAHQHARVGGPVPAAPRTGRQKQLYAPGGERLVAGTIPVRVHGEGITGVEVLLISSRAGKGYCFPKGGWEDDETVEMAAKRETLEEAGVRGELEEPILGKFPFKSGKMQAGEPPSAPHHGHGCIAHMYVLHVVEMLEVWPELERQRIWVPLVEAVKRCRAQWMREALLAWVRRKGWELPADCLSLILPSNASSEPLASPTASMILSQPQLLQQQLLQLGGNLHMGGGAGAGSVMQSSSGTSSTTPVGGSPLGGAAGPLGAAGQADGDAVWGPGGA